MNPHSPRSHPWKIYHQLLLTLRTPTQTSPAGLTLLECLVAMVVITIVVGLIATPILITVGSRVQNRRADQAAQLAQNYIERARVVMNGVDTGSAGWTSHLVPPSGIPYSANPNPDPSSVGYAKINLVTVGVPKTASGVCDPNQATTTATDFCDDAFQLQKIDLDNDGTIDLYAQVFRANDIQTDDGLIVGFEMGVRIYPTDAVDSSGSILAASSLGTEKATLNLTQKRRIDSKVQPLVTFYSSLYKGDNSETLVSFNACSLPNIMNQSTTSGNGTINSTITAAGLVPQGTDLKTKWADKKVIDQDPDPAVFTQVLCSSTVTYTYIYDQPTNVAPTAVADTYNTSTEYLVVNPGETISINVLANDTDPDNTDANPNNNDTLSIQGVSSSNSSLGGTLGFSTSTVQYTAPTNKTFAANGADTFSYTMQDYGPAHPQKGTSTASVSVYINAPPVAVNDTYTSGIATGGSVTLDVIQNTSPGLTVSGGADSDPDAALPTARLGHTNDKLVLTIQGGSFLNSSNSTPASGSVTAVQNAAGYYEVAFVAPSVADTYTFKYTLTDPKGLTSNVATVTVPVITNNPPTVQTDYACFTKTSANVTIPVLTTNAGGTSGNNATFYTRADTDTDAITVVSAVLDPSLTTTATGGTIGFTTSGVTYTAGNNSGQEAYIRYGVQDSGGNLVYSRVRIYVGNNNSCPSAAATNGYPALP